MPCSHQKSGSIDHGAAAVDSPMHINYCPNLSAPVNYLTKSRSLASTKAEFLGLGQAPSLITHRGASNPLLESANPPSPPLNPPRSSFSGVSNHINQQILRSHRSLINVPAPANSARLSSSSKWDSAERWLINASPTKFEVNHGTQGANPVTTSLITLGSSRNPARQTTCRADSIVRAANPHIRSTNAESSITDADRLALTHPIPVHHDQMLKNKSRDNAGTHQLYHQDQVAPRRTEAAGDADLGGSITSNDLLTPKSPLIPQRPLNYLRDAFTDFSPPRSPPHKSPPLALTSPANHTFCEPNRVINSHPHLQLQVKLKRDVGTQITPENSRCCSPVMKTRIPNDVISADRIAIRAAISQSNQVISDGSGKRTGTVVHRSPPRHNTPEPMHHSVCNISPMISTNQERSACTEQEEPLAPNGDCVLIPDYDATRAANTKIISAPASVLSDQYHHSNDGPNCTANYYDPADRPRRTAIGSDLACGQHEPADPYQMKQTKLRSKSKIERKEAEINAWEKQQKAKAEAQLKKLEMKVERLRNEGYERIRNRWIAAQVRAQEMRVSAQVRHANINNNLNLDMVNSSDTFGHPQETHICAMDRELSSSSSSSSSSQSATIDSLKPSTSSKSKLFSGNKFSESFHRVCFPLGL